MAKAFHGPSRRVGRAGKSGLVTPRVKVSKKNFRRKGTGILKRDTHVDISAVVMASIGTVGSEVREEVKEAMLEVWRSSGAAFGSPPWAPLEESWQDVKDDLGQGDGIMFQTGVLYDVVQSGGMVVAPLEKTAFPTVGGIRQMGWSVGWPTTPHRGTGGLTMADLAAIHEFGAEGEKFSIPARPWLSRAMVGASAPMANRFQGAIDTGLNVAAGAVMARAAAGAAIQGIGVK